MKKIILLLGLLILLSVVVNLKTESTYYLSSTLNVAVKAIDKDGNILYDEEIIDSDLFLQGWFKSKGSFPITLNLRRQFDTVEQEFLLQRSFLKHTLLHIDSYHDEISLTELRRIYQPMFQ